MLTIERLREVAVYDPETGLFATRDGMPMGYCDKSTGYVRISIDRQRHWAHRLAWFYMTGEWPAELIDHRDTVGTNNCWANLREADKSLNGMNRGRPSNNKSGLKGVSFCKATGLWRADIHVRGKRINLGRFASPHEAHAAYIYAAETHFGEYARAA